MACLIGTVLGLLCRAAGAAQTAPDGMTRYETRYYLLYTDVGPDDAREIALRIDQMAEEYARRTKGFSGAIKRKFPLYVYADKEAYWATGAPRASGGLFDRNNKVLRVLAGDELGLRTWNTVQHEGFHQFAFEVIGGELPAWVNEGMAEYFGEAVFTGDGFVSGVIPQWRLQRVRRSIQQNKFRPLTEMMRLTLPEWNAQLDVGNYDQAWAMTQFLAHADNGRYQKAFGNFMYQIGQGKNWEAAWKANFGDTDGFEQRWRGYWLELPDYPTADLHARALVMTLTSFAARAHQQKQTFDNAEAFLEAAKQGSLKNTDADWLPPRLLRGALKEVQDLVEAGGSLSLKPAGAGKTPVITATLPDGTKVTGSFRARGGKVTEVSADVDTASRKPGAGRPPAKRPTEMLRPRDESR